MTTPHAETPPAPASATAEATHAPCRNCGTPLLGPHCYACGQPVKGLVRPLGNLFGDLMDSVFNIDTRIVRTLGPLFARPGMLTTEYFAGRQVRYVTPVRLFFFLCILAFFVGRFAIDGDSGVNVNIGGQDDSIGAATTEAQVIARRDEALARLATQRAKLPDGPGKAGADAGLRAGEAAIRAESERRLTNLREAGKAGKPVPPPDEESMNFNGKPWDARTNPLHLPGAPGFVDGWFNDKVGRAKQNLARIKADPSQYTQAFIGAIPTALFVLVPLFALMLKLAFVFKRRLYMEHVVVALHSHAFLSLDLLLVFGCMLLQGLVPDGGLLDDALAWCIGLLVAWAPIYLLLMQKRVYAQGWPMTLLKYWALGTVYMVLLSLAIVVAAAASLVWM